MNTPFLKSYYRQKSIYLTSEQIETIRSLKDKEDREHQQQIIQSTISTEILSISTTPLNAEIKKRSSKTWSKSVLCNNELCPHISNLIPTNNSDVVIFTFNETEKINSENLGELYKKEARRDEKNKVNMSRLLATT
ncbi:39744_t:CDS:2 [Gigaspora margarita]|uniref:39744_t:CDS:1 n=1 Tax=Gigaspora margarita TaxID=4874 RepID=A0ABN7W6B2_GIGMA|nr:39744_t:CDS:2 [Gigaspora margarita]